MLASNPGLNGRLTGDMMIGIISAISKNGIIGTDGAYGFHIPWNYPEDLKHFQKTTVNSTVIMGRKTFESIGKPLKNRNNVIISSMPSERLFTQAQGASIFTNIPDALASCDTCCKDVWFIGGASIYEEAMQYATKIVLTMVPDIVDTKDCLKVVRFPFINPLMFEIKKIDKLGENLKVVTYESV
jgi:dihydrofolate reductase